MTSDQAILNYLKKDKHEALLAALPSLLPPSLSSISLKNVISGIRLFLRWAKDENVNILNLSEASHYKTWLNKEYLPATTKNRLSQVRRLYDVLVNLNLVSQNPFTEVIGPLNFPHEHRNTYTPEEIEHLLAYANLEERALVLLGAFTGLSGAEAMQLNFNQIKLDTGQIILPKRVLPLESIVADTLELWGKRRGHLLLFPSSGLVFDLESSFILRKKIFLLCQKSNVTYKAWHPLRNHAGLRLLKNQDSKSTAYTLGLAGRESIRPLVKIKQQLENNQDKAKR